MFLTFKTLHLIAMVAWFAGLFYLPRLFVYRLQNHGDKARTMLDTMARRLEKGIMTPAMVVTWGCGLGMIAAYPDILQSGGWLHAKLGLVVLLTLYHISLMYFRRQLVAGTCTRGERFFRLYNEVPTLFLLVIVYLAVVKPF